MHEQNCFITLTYDQVNVPEDGSLNVRDWQLFAKRARKRGFGFRYYMCGEYGDKTLRPHFHACVFGRDFRAGGSVIRSRNGQQLFESPLLSELWGLGFASVGALEYQSAQYVTRYVMKKRRGKDTDGRYDRVNLETGELYTVRPEFSTMSRRPGIGSEFFNQYKGDIYPHDEVVADGKKFRPPRFYDEKLPEGELSSLKAKRLKVAKAFRHNQTYERLRTRETHAHLLEDQRKRDRA